ncbi:SDR family NAD(P)-dependent oxidoreductase [Microbacterium sp. NM3R9]|uniref:SDR family oxidoreductase n=1 Tax=Microbacterium thalli TaxID=3027921 RepID=UPI0023672FD5|nr:SDR family NAD(P)-dependent oxidoreductase [Microbacterium thalli]MDN8548011.1 SDR family NAD(P)-dependent oxidoreductase [Microbacterium thalli]
MKLTGAVAIVTGASSGIGRSTALDLARQGASVALVARRQDRLDALVSEINEIGGTALAVPTDIADRAQAFAAVAATVERFGRLDMLINNAGLMILGRVQDADIDDWDRMIAINQQGLMAMTKAALPHLLDAARGDRQVADIVNVSSVAGRMTFPTAGPYSLTKFGVNGFTEALRQELAGQKVRVGVLEPGKVDTELDSHNNDEILAHIEENFGGFRMLDPQDIADGITFMVTRPAHAAIAELWAMPSAQA